MKIETFDIEGPLKIIPRVFGDDRGFFFESYRKKAFLEHGLNLDFVQDNMSFSKKGTLRGLHYQIENPQGKLVRVAQGKVLDVAVDIRKDSPTFGKSVACILDSQKHEQLFVPAGFAHGFQVLSDTAIFEYKCTNYYTPSAERGILWNDPDLELPWEPIPAILSEKDTLYPTLKNVQLTDLF